MRHFYLCSTAALFVSLATSASAQEAQDTTALDDIVVTANRTESLASKTPVALTAVSGNTLRSAGITNPTNLADQVPNLSIDRTNSGLQITIRGVTSSDGSEKGDPSAAFMLDGIYIARPQAQEVSFFDISRVEVLRGPQGTLYGRNTTAGLVNVITNRPGDRFEASIDAAYGNFDTRQLTAMINLPVNENIAVRGAFNYDRRDSYLIAGPSLTSGLSPYKDNLSGRLSALFKLGNGELLLRGDYADIKGNTLNQVNTTEFFTGFSTPGVNPVYIAKGRSNEALRTINSPVTTPLDQHNKTWGITADFHYDFDAVVVSYLGSYRELTRNENSAFLLGNGAASIPTRFDGSYWQHSEEVRLSTNGDGPLKAQAGLYYFQEQSKVRALSFGLLNPVPGDVGYVFGFPQDPVKSKSWASFAQGTYSLTSALRLTAGVRYSHDDKSRFGGVVACSTTACNQPGDQFSPNDASRKFSKTTWRIGADYDVNDRTLIYGVISTGYKAGGFNDGCESTTPGCTTPRTAETLYYEPETLTAYEVGLKAGFLDNAIRFNASAFHYDYKALQLSQVGLCSTNNNAPCQFTTNAAAAKVDGIELEAVIRPTSDDRFDVNANWLDARYNRFTPQILRGSTVLSTDWKGKKLDRSPSWTISAGYVHTFHLDNGGDIQAGVRTRISDSYVLAATGTLNQFRQPGYSKTDATLTYNAPNKRWYLQAFVKNIENKIVVTTADSSALGTVQLADPRTYGIRTGLKF